MQELPHHYSVTTALDADGLVSLRNENAPAMSTSAPPEFDGPEGYWSPETLLVASVASCFLLTFRAGARASKLDWEALSCDVSGVLENVDKKLQFTEFRIDTELLIEKSADVNKAERLLEKAEGSCLISNSLNAKMTLSTNVTTSQD